jgi:hypothetical protein
MFGRTMIIGIYFHSFVIIQRISTNEKKNEIAIDMDLNVRFAKYNQTLHFILIFKLSSFSTFLGEIQIVTLVNSENADANLQRHILQIVHLFILF